MLPRRKFLQLTGASLGAVAFSTTLASEIRKRIETVGIQLFTIPQMASKDLKGTLQILADIGYKEIEFFGPYSFSAQETIDRWEPIAKQLGITGNAFYGYSIADVGNMLGDYNLKCPSVHLDLITLRKNMKSAMDHLSGLGVKYVAIPAILEPERKSIDDYKRLADEFNSFGEQMSGYGIAFVYHNHGYEHAPMQNEIPMEVLLKNTNAKNVRFEMDIFWMKAGGAEPEEYLKSYPGRYKLMHVKDALEPIRFSGDGGTSDQWMALFPKMTDPGKGVFDIESILTQAKNSGVEHFFLERDLAPDAMTTLKDSYKYLSSF